MLRSLILRFTEREPLGVQLVLLLLALSVATYFIGFSDEDRILTVSCEDLNGVFLATISPSDIDDSSFGLFSARRDKLGEMVLMQDRDGVENARWSSVHTLNSPSKVETHSKVWFRSFLHARLETDLDGEELIKPLRTIVDSILLSGTRMIIYGADQRAITGVLSAVNSDPKALSVLQGATAKERYLIVSSIVFAKHATLAYVPNWGAVPSTPVFPAYTFKLGRTYFHTDYSCKPLEEIGVRAGSREEPVPVVYFYTAVRYDDVTKRAEIDLRPVDIRSADSR